MLGVAAGVALPPLFFFKGKETALPLFMGALFVFFFYGMVKGRELKDSAIDVAFKALGLMYIALPLAYLAPLREMDGGQWWILFLLVVIWSSDTLAFLTGKLLGRHRLAPEISPKKTIEGAIGGLSGAFIAAFFFNMFAGMGMGLKGVFVLSIAIGFIAMIGDLAESLLKRSAGVKDSGSIIPGHGGILDRIDSILFPIPLLYYFLACF